MPELRQAGGMNPDGPAGFWFLAFDIFLAPEGTR